MRGLGQIGQGSFIGVSPEDSSDSWLSGKSQSQEGGLYASNPFINITQTKIEQIEAAIIDLDARRETMSHEQYLDRRRQSCQPLTATVNER